MPDEKPSYANSTLSQAFVLSLVFYMATIFMVTVGLIFFNTDVEKAKLVIGWASALEAAISSAYLTARKVNGEVKSSSGGTNVETPERPSS